MTTLEDAARAFADLALAGARGGDGLRSIFATVTDATVGAVYVRPDGSLTEDLRVSLVSGSVAVADRVLCLFIPGGGVWAAFGK